MKKIIPLLFLTGYYATSCVTYNYFGRLDGLYPTLEYGSDSITVGLGPTSGNDKQDYFDLFLGLANHYEWEELPNDSIGFDSVCISLFDEYSVSCPDLFVVSLTTYGIIYPDVFVPRSADSLKVSFDVVSVDWDSRKEILREKYIQKLYRTKKRYTVLFK